MLVSIITSVYNCENYISEMLDSILTQTYSDWELIIFDDASTDKTWNIITQYSDLRIKKIRNKKNRGLTFNLNKALEMAQGAYVLRIDGDDIAYPQRLEKQIQFMNQHQDIVLSGCWMHCFGEKNFIMQNDLDWKVLKIKLFFNANTFHPTFIMRKSVLDLYQIRYNEKLRYAQDYDIEYQLNKYGKISNIPEVLMKYRFHFGQISYEKLKEQREYANVTRKLILEELGIKLNTEEYIAWQHFCMLESTDKLDKELLYVKNIIENIILSNKKSEKYNSILLEKILYNRLETHRNNYLSKNQHRYNINTEENKYQRLFLMMTQWKRLNTQHKHIDSFLIKRNIKSIAIYGMGHAGRALMEELHNKSVEVKYCIDKNIEGIITHDCLSIVKPEDDFINVDAIIVTAIQQYEEIKDMLWKKIHCKIFSLEEIIYSM